MPILLPGTSVSVSFYTFSGQYPPLYYASGEGTLTLASVNAGNSDGLCVGLGGVNGAFLRALTAAGQKRANLIPSADDYQDRHHKLLAQAGATGTAFAAYTPVDPSAFSYADASAPVSQVQGWHEGVCFVDVFDAALRPHGNAKNAGMLYCAPPYDVHYANVNSFLAAIEATAENIIRTIAGYNALAAQHGQPVIEALRNTLYSSNIYNQNLQAPAGDIAKAILAGFTAGLLKYPQSGLMELQFPVGTGAAQEPLFAPLQAILG